MGKVEDVNDSADSNKGGVADPQRVLLLQGTQLVTVDVGSDEGAESWTIHKRLLAHHSPFFAAAFNGNFAESATNTVSLIEDDPDAFKLFVQWLYSGELALGELASDSKSLPRVACLAWALGDKLQCPVFQDRAMLQLLAYHKYEWLLEDTMRLIYNVSPSGSKLRSFAVDTICYDRLVKQNPGIATDGIVAVVDFNRDLLERIVTFDSTESGEDPCDEGSPYLKVLDFEKNKVERDI
ncbi:MAG: hypothetical protein Q9180_006312, partial [Flavoplaca navasiana]